MLLVVSLAALYLFGLGYVLNFLPKSKETLLERIGLTFGLGVLINYSIVLLTQKLLFGFVAGFAFWVVGVFRFIYDLWKNKKFYSVNLASFLLVLLLLILYYIKIFSDPLHDWDARSIWFFHAKMIWAEGAINHISNWHHLSLQWSHPDYPKLIPSMAAQFGYIKGYWNEFFPKGSLFLMLFPPVFWVFSFYRKSIGFVLLILITFFILNSWLWNGYMDGYLALYASITVLLFGRYYQEKRPIDLYSGICALGIVSNLKNEGQLFCICVILSIIIIELIVNTGTPFWRMIKGRKINLNAFGVATISFLPVLIWNIYKKLWELHSDLNIGSLDVLKRISGRVTDGSSPQLIFKAMFFNVNHTISQTSKAYALYLGLLFIIILIKKMPSIGSYLSLLVSLFYFSGIYLVYLLTPHDLSWHLSSSADRTMFPVSMCVLIGVVFLIFQFESKEGQ